MKCPTCNAEDYKPTESERPPPAPRKPLPANFKSLAYLLDKNERCEKDWKKFLKDMCGRTECTKKQYGFYSVIHQKCLGSWPEKRFEDLVQEPAESPLGNNEEWSDEDLNNTF